MLLCVTANHRTASFDVLDRVSREVAGTAAELVEATDFVRGAVVLATCNRFEAYLELDDPVTGASAVATEAVFATLAERVGADAVELRRSAEVLTGDEVARHLFAVSSGLESVVVGEDEISGQVQRALATARAEGTTSRGLERLFQRAGHTSRGVKAQVGLGGAGRSMVRLALELAGSRITDWSAARILVIGTGNYAGTTVAALRERGVVDVRVFSPSGRGAPFAARHSIRLESELAAAIADAELVVAVTGSQVVNADHVSDGRRRLVIDLGMPRNVDPAVALHAELLDLETIRLHAPAGVLDAADTARDLVGRAAAEFAADEALAPAVVALRRHVFDLLDAEIDRARAKGDDGRAEEALRHLAGVLLHGPSGRARELAIEGRGAEFVRGLEAVYGIRMPAPLETLAPVEREASA